MQFLVDPAQVTLRPPAWLFLLIICVLLPLGALRQHRRLAAGTLRPRRWDIYRSAIATHLAFLLLCWFVARAESLDLFPAFHVTASAVAVGLVALAAGVLPMLMRLRARDPVTHERLRLIAPGTPREFAGFYLVSVSAGVAEEIAYRGVLFTLLAALLASWWLAALVAAAAFGIVHLFQGWKSAGIAALIGLRDHVVVGLTGTLVVAIVVHTLHDVITGTVVGLQERTP